LQDFLDAIK
jgi:hypothetical protein